jgi:hypothetical protein
MIKMTAQLAGNKAFRHIEEVRSEWKKALLEEGRAIKKEYEKTTETWKHHVTFNIRPHVSGRVNWYTEVFSSGPNSRIYWFVHEGIAVMHAVLSPDWVPKTQPKVLGSGPGSGRVVRIRPEYEGPLYEPREFTDTIIEVRQPEFQKRMEHATAVGARKATQGG